MLSTDFTPSPSTSTAVVTRKCKLCEEMVTAHIPPPLDYDRVMRIADADFYCEFHTMQGVLAANGITRD